MGWLRKFDDPIGKHACHCGFLGSSGHTRYNPEGHIPHSPIRCIIGKLQIRFRTSLIKQHWDEKTEAARRGSIIITEFGWRRVHPVYAMTVPKATLEIGMDRYWDDEEFSRTHVNRYWHVHAVNQRHAALLDQIYAECACGD